MSEWRWILSNAFWPWKKSEYRTPVDYFCAALWWLLLGQVLNMLSKWGKP